MKKLCCFLICISMLLAFGCGCVKSPQTQSGKLNIESGTTLPNLYDDTAKSPLGQFDETTAFGILIQTNDDGMVLEMQNKYFLFHWTDTSKKYYEKLGIRLTDEVGVEFEVRDGKLYAHALSLVNAQ